MFADYRRCTHTRWTVRRLKSARTFDHIPQYELALKGSAQREGAERKGDVSRERVGKFRPSEKRFTARASPRKRFNTRGIKKQGVTKRGIPCRACGIHSSRAYVRHVRKPLGRKSRIHRRAYAHDKSGKKELADRGANFRNFDSAPRRNLEIVLAGAYIDLAATVAAAPIVAAIFETTTLLHPSCWFALSVAGGPVNVVDNVAKAEASHPPIIQRRKESAAREILLCSVAGPSHHVARYLIATLRFPPTPIGLVIVKKGGNQGRLVKAHSAR